MAASPQWKVYDSEKIYRGCTKEPEAAAVLAEFYGEGATVRYGHSRVVWTAGTDKSDSWDDVAATMHARSMPTPDTRTKQ